MPDTKPIQTRKDETASKATIQKRRFKRSDASKAAIQKTLFDTQTSSHLAKQIGNSWRTLCFGFRFGIGSKPKCWYFSIGRSLLLNYAKK
jgi:hypothetical protein